MMGGDLEWGGGKQTIPYSYSSLNYIKYRNTELFKKYVVGWMVVVLVSCQLVVQTKCI